MGFWMIVILANLIVGVLVGLTGVAGFLLPIVYTGPLGMGVPEGLALSFAAVIVSGALGARNCKRAGNLEHRQPGGGGAGSEAEPGDP